MQTIRSLTATLPHRRHFDLRTMVTAPLVLALTLMMCLDYARHLL